MKITEITESVEQIVEGGDASTKRFYSELGALAAWASPTDDPSFDPDKPQEWLDPDKLDNSDKAFKDIRRFLGGAKKKYDASEKKAHMDIEEYYNLSKRAKSLILKDMADKGIPEPTMFGWVGGENVLSVGATPSDVNFIDNPIAGVSIKDDGGLGVGNLGAGELEFEGSGDLFARLAPKELYELKNAVMGDLLTVVKQRGSYEAEGKPYYRMSWNPTTQKYRFDAKGKKSIEGTEEQALNWGFLQKSNEYQRPLGDYFLKNNLKYKEYTDALLMATSDKIKTAIEEKVIPNADKLAKLGGFGSQPYYYQLAKPFKVAYVPDKSTANDIEILDITPPTTMSGGLKYIIALRRRGMEGKATVEVHIRYAQGIFGSSPSFRIQTLKGHKNLYWEVLTPEVDKKGKGKVPPPDESKTVD